MQMEVSYERSLRNREGYARDSRRIKGLGSNSEETAEMPTEDYLNTSYPLQEDYPGQKDEMRRSKIAQEAVDAADTIILDGSSGHVEETDYLTGIVAARFVEKVAGRLQSELLKHDLDKRLGDKVYICESCKTPNNVPKGKRYGIITCSKCGGHNFEVSNR